MHRILHNQFKDSVLQDKNEDNIFRNIISNYPNNDPNHLTHVANKRASNMPNMSSLFPVAEDVEWIIKEQKIVSESRKNNKSKAVLFCRYTTQWPSKVKFNWNISKAFLWCMKLQEQTYVWLGKRFTTFNYKLQCRWAHFLIRPSANPCYLYVDSNTILGFSTVKKIIFAQGTLSKIKNSSCANIHLRYHTRHSQLVWCGYYLAGLRTSCQNPLN